MFEKMPNPADEESTLSSEFSITLPFGSVTRLCYMISLTSRIKLNRRQLKFAMNLGKNNISLEPCNMS